MKFSTKAEYGLRAIIRIAQNNKNPLSLAKISEAENLSLGYLEKLMAKLKKSGLVKSTKGAIGGYCLAKNPRLITLAEIIKSLEGSLAPFYCVEKDHLRCRRHCLTQKVWSRLYQETNKIMEKINLQSLIK
jgi:Rrf2 family protein